MYLRSSVVILDSYLAGLDRVLGNAGALEGEMEEGTGKFDRSDVGDDRIIGLVITYK